MNVTKETAAVSGARAEGIRADFSIKHEKDQKQLGNQTLNCLKNLSIKWQKPHFLMAHRVSGIADAA